MFSNVFFWLFFLGCFFEVLLFQGLLLLMVVFSKCWLFFNGCFSNVFFWVVFL